MPRRCCPPSGSSFEKLQRLLGLLHSAQKLGLGDGDVCIARRERDGAIEQLGRFGELGGRLFKLRPRQQHRQVFTILLVKTAQDGTRLFEAALMTQGDGEAAFDFPAD